jgi:hypothetical protein
MNQGGYNVAAQNVSMLAERALNKRTDGCLWCTQ